MSVVLKINIRNKSILPPKKNDLHKGRSWILKYPLENGWKREDRIHKKQVGLENHGPRRTEDFARNTWTRYINMIQRDVINYNMIIYDRMQGFWVGDYLQ